MARIKLLLPSSFSFSTQIPVRITDINYGGHVGNDAILSLIHEVRVQFLNHFGFTEMNFAGTSLIMSDVAIEFKSELFYGDVLTAYATAAEFSRAGFDIFYKITKIHAGKEATVVIAKTGMVCYNYDSKKVVAIPEAAIQALMI